MIHTLSSFLPTSLSMSTHPCSPIRWMACRVSPADRYISAAARGSFILAAQSAFFLISIFLSDESAAESRYSLAWSNMRRSVYMVSAFCSCPHFLYSLAASKNLP